MNLVLFSELHWQELSIGNCKYWYSFYMYDNCHINSETYCLSISLSRSSSGSRAWKKKKSENFILLFPACLVHLTNFAKLYNYVIGQYQWNHDKNCLIMQINIQRGLKTSIFKAKMVLFKSSFDVDTHNYTGFFFFFLLLFHYSLFVHIFTESF